MGFESLPGRIQSIPTYQYHQPPVLIKQPVGPMIAQGVAGLGKVITDNFSPQAVMAKRLATAQTLEAEQKAHNYIYGIPDPATQALMDARAAMKHSAETRELLAIEKARQAGSGGQAAGILGGKAAAFGKGSPQGGTTAQPLPQFTAPAGGVQDPNSLGGMGQSGNFSLDAAKAPVPLSQVQDPNAPVVADASSTQEGPDGEQYIEYQGQRVPLSLVQQVLGQMTAPQQA